VIYDRKMFIVQATEAAHFYDLNCEHQDCHKWPVL